MLVSAVQQCESSMCIHTASPSRLPPTTPHATPLSHHRALAELLPAELLSLDIVFLGFSHTVAGTSRLLLFIAEKFSVVKAVPCFVYPFTSWWAPRLLNFWLLWIRCCEHLHKSLNRHMFSFLLSRCIGIELLSHVICVCLWYVYVWLFFF